MIAADRLPRDRVLVVTGSLNAKPQDRRMQREDLRPVQAYLDGQWIPLPAFDGLGELGVSSMVADPVNPGGVFASTGNDLLHIDARTGLTETIDVPRLVDVHEIDVYDGLIWIANTGCDEVVSVGLETRRVGRRVRLEKYRQAGVGIETDVSDDGPVEVRDRFHVNQYFKGIDGHEYALVHHVTGRQVIRKIAERMLKSHGNGGVIDLTLGRGIALNLKAPHSVRIVDGGYWVFDSGGRMIRQYDAHWTETATIATRGWGRGAAVAADGRTLFAGISATRKRYLGVIDGHRLSGNLVQVFDVASGAETASLEIDSIEQVNNVYLLERDIVTSLARAA